MIRSLQLNDRSELKRILTDTNHFNDEEISVAMELIDIFLNKPEQKDYIIYVYVTDDSNKTAGYICYGRRPLTEAVYDLYWIAVDPQVHGKGIGRNLVKYMEDDVLNNLKGSIILIETSGKPEYENERKFYEKCGYQIQTVIKSFYRRSDDLVVYIKYLNSVQ
jgi:ribosomal protein S18 acetylase RimI-like enzyme